MRAARRAFLRRMTVGVGSMAIGASGGASIAAALTSGTFAADPWRPPPPVDPPPVASGIITAFALSSSTSGVKPFTVGVGFRKGEAASVSTNLANYQVVVKRTWLDGSIKHAVISGRAPLTAGTPLTVNIFKGSPSAVPALTVASVIAAAPTAIVQCGPNTASLAGLLAHPFRTWISGPEMVECHYHADAGPMSVWFHVRLYADGRMRVRAVVENGYLDNGAVAAARMMQTYDANVTVGGETVCSKAGLTHYSQTAWMAEGWIGGDPDVTALHDVDYLQSTKLVPNYAIGGQPTDAVLNALPSSYTPMAKGSWTSRMGTAGFQPQIGLLPNWDALYCKSGDARALRAVETNSHSLKSYAIAWRGATSKQIIKPSEFPTWTVGGPKKGGLTSTAAGPLTWDNAHHGSGGYLAYLLTGDYAHLETLAMQAATVYITTSSARGSGVNRFLQPPSIRGCAWAFRTVAQYAALAPDGDIIAAEYRTLLANSYTTVNGHCTMPGASPIGIPFALSTYNPAKPLSQAPWMLHFWIAVNGHAWDIEPGFVDTTAHRAVRDFMYRAAVGILGANNPGSYSYTQAGAYKYTIGPEVRPNFAFSEPDTFFQTWGEVFAATYGGPNTASDTPLEGTSGGRPGGADTGYWGNLMPAIAYAVDHGASGAAESWARMTGAPNWSDVANSGFGNVPVWGITPRTPAPPVVVVPPVVIEHPGAVPAWVAGLPLWHWYEIPGTALSKVAPVPKPLGVGSSRMKIDAWCGAALKRKGSVYLIGAAGGHADYGGNEVDALALNAETPAWVQLRGPSADDQIIDETPFYLDLRGAACHTYYTSQMIESRGRLVVFRGQGVSGGPFRHPPANWPYMESNWHKAFNLATNDWDAPNYIARIQSNGSTTAGAMCCQNPLTGDVYFSVQGSVGRGWHVWTNATNTWERTSGTSINYCGSAFDCVRNRILTVGGWRKVPPTVRNLDGSQQVVTFGGLGEAAITDATNDYPGVVYDEANDCFLVLRNVGHTISMNRVDARTLEVTAPTMTGALPTARTNGIQNSVQYVPELRGIVIANRHDGNVYFARTAIA